MRTQEAVLDRINESKDDILGFGREALALFLDFDHARSLLNPDVEPEDWNKDARPLTREAVFNEIRSYMEFAWGKVEDHRGISASRSVDKIGAWLWLLGDEDLCRRFESAPYENYGAPQLAVACKALDLPIPTDQAVLNMINGKACRPGCDEGCGA